MEAYSNCGLMYVGATPAVLHLENSKRVSAVCVDRRFSNVGPHKKGTAKLGWINERLVEKRMDMVACVRTEASTWPIKHLHTAMGPRMIQ